MKNLQHHLGLVGVLMLLSLLAVHAADTKVRYVHLAMTGSTTEMNVGWYTQDRTATSTVQFGTKPPFTGNATGVASEWYAGYGFNHFAVLRDLVPGTRYYYRCGDASGGWSAVYSFVTPPDNTDTPFTIAIYGDMGIVNAQNTANGVNSKSLKDEIDWVYHVGDISYADDHVFDFQNTWNTWAGMMENTTSIKPYMVLPGNHEYTSWDPFLFFETHNFVVYNHRFMMPGSTSGAQKSMYYSFDYSNVHFVSLSTETSYPDAPFGNDFGDQLSWLEADLAKANQNRHKRPWIIVGGHRPIYSSSGGYSDLEGNPTNGFFPLGGSNAATLQKTFEELFMKYGVDAYFTGHVHSYERNYPAYKGKKVSDYTNPKAPVGIVVGNAGCVEGLTDLDPSKWNNPAPSWSAFRWGTGWGYGILAVNNLTLKWDFYDASTQSVIDSVTITKTL